MARYSPLWQQNSSYPASIDRGLISALWPTPATTGAAPTIVPSSLNVSIPAGAAAVALSAANLSELCRWDAAETVTLGAVPPSGQSRVDLVVLQVRDTAIDAGSNNDFLFAVVAGAPTTGTPVVPSPPANALTFCQVTVPGGATNNLNAATLVDLRPVVKLAVPPPGLLAAVSLNPTTQVGTAIGGSWNSWDPNFTISFIAPPSGNVVLSFEAYVAIPAGGVVAAGWAGGGITAGQGPATASSVTLFSGTGPSFRASFSSYIYGLTPATRYSPVIAAISGNSLVSNWYYGGPGTGTFTNSAGPVVMTARAAP